MRRLATPLILCLIGLTGCPQLPTIPEKGTIPPHLTLGFPGPLDFNRFFANVDDTFNVTVFYPATEEPITDAPLVVFNVGWNAIRNTYESYCIQLAQWGYVCVIRYYPSLGMLGFGNDLFEFHVDHALRVIDWTAEQNADPTSPIFGMVDTDTVAMAGHSLGGSASLVAMPQDDRIRTVVSIDALFEIDEKSRVFDFDASDASVLFIGATAPSLCGQAPTATLDLWAMADAPKQRVMIQGADHMDFMEAPPNSPDSQDVGDAFCQTGTAPAVDVRTTAHRYLIAWLNYHIRGQEEFITYFSGDIAQADVDAGWVTIDAVWE